MAHDRPISEWKPIKLFPWAESRVRMAFLDTNPNVPLDLVAPFNEYRWRVPKARYHKKADGILMIAEDGRARFLSHFERILLWFGIHPS